MPGDIAQANVIRTFVSRAEAMGIDYNIIEAFDAPWKSFEGSVGQYWGIFDADRHLKFPLTGAITQPTYGRTAVLALLLGVALSLPMLRLNRMTGSQAACWARPRRESARGSRWFWTIGPRIMSPAAIM